VKRCVAGARPFCRARVGSSPTATLLDCDAGPVCGRSDSWTHGGVASVSNAARQGLAWLGEASPGWARLGVAKQGKVFSLTNGSNMETMNVTIRGVCPLLMHNGRLSDPLDPASKALKAATAVRKKADEQHGEIARLEWLGGLVTDDEGFPALSAESLMATIRDGARKSKLGKAMAAAVFVLDDAKLLVGDTRPAAELYEEGGKFVDRRSVRVGQARVMRTRPRFDKWSATVAITYNESLINPEQIKQALDDAGQQVGIGDFRPRFGRFECVK
jgi:hypothetical protein